MDREYRRYVIVMGELYQMSATRYKAYLSDIVDQGWADVTLYGRSLGRVPNTTDWTVEDARRALEELNNRRKLP